MSELIIIKIGGGKSTNVKNVVNDVAGVMKENPEKRFIVLHGASNELDVLHEKMNVKKKILDLASGFESRKTDDEVMDLLLMAYAGKTNKRIVEQFQQLGINSVGLSGVDGKLMEARRNKAIKINENGKKLLLKDDLSGTVEKINSELLNSLIEKGYLPVLSVPPALSDDFKAVNVDADFASSLVASSLNASHLLFLSNVPGLLRDSSNPNSLISKVSLSNFDEVLSFAKARMKKKLLAAKHAAENGVSFVLISNSNNNAPVHNALSGNYSGTLVTNE